MTEPPIESARHPEPARRARRQVAGLLVLAFLAGAAADHAAIGLAGRFLGPGMHGRPRGPGMPGPGLDGGGPDHMIERLSRELSLDPSTEQRVRAVFDSHRAQVESVVRRLGPEMKKVRDDTDSEIRAVLPPEKREAFDRFIAGNRPPGDDMHHPEGGPPRPDRDRMHGDRPPGDRMPGDRPPGNRPPPPRPGDPDRDGPPPGDRPPFRPGDPDRDGPPPGDRPPPRPPGD